MWHPKSERSYPLYPAGLCNAFCREVCFSSLDVDFVEVVCPTELGAAPRHDSSKSLQNALHNPMFFCQVPRWQPKPALQNPCQPCVSSVIVEMSMHIYPHRFKSQHILPESEPPLQVSTDSPATTKSQTRDSEHHKKWIPTELVTFPWTEPVVAKKVPPTKS